MNLHIHYSQLSRKRPPWVHDNGRLQEVVAYEKNHENKRKTHRDNTFLAKITLIGKRLKALAYFTSNNTWKILSYYFRNFA